MRKHALLVVAAVLVTANAVAQDEHEYKKKAPKVIHATETGPVTNLEAQATFKRLGTVIKSVLHTGVPSWTEGTNTPASRFAVASYFLKMYRTLEPIMTVSPVAISVEVNRISAPTKGQRDGIASLVKKGFVGNFGPLATGKGSSLTVEQFGDAIGLFVSRLAENTHTPSSKWTPYLHGN